MAKWTNAVITDLGKALENKVLSGETITITRVTAGQGTVRTIDLRSQTALVNEKQNLSITESKSDIDVTTISVLLTVADLEESYNLQQIGFFANDPDVGEILFAISQDESGTILPTKDEIPMYSINFNFHFAMVNDSGMTVTVDKNALVTNEQLADERKARSEAVELLSDNLSSEVTRAKAAEKTNADNLVSHTGNKSNPHGVTKSQVGLGNVPNVSTNDQTPTYTDTTTFATLSSGEKMSVLLPKIKLAITNLINHISNKSNPHGVTKSQVGLGNVDNTSDVSKPVSTEQQKAIDAAYANSNYYTDEKIAALIDGAPSTLDTLKEIADAMAEHEDVVKALNDAIGTKANENEFTSHVNDSSNPHGVTKSQVGLGNVDNTSDLDKPISTATQNKFDEVESKLSQALYIVSFDSSTGTLTTKSADYTG